MDLSYLLKILLHIAIQYKRFDQYIVSIYSGILYDINDTLSKDI